jgi:hypothetical protein
MKIERRLSEGIGGWLTFETHCNKVGLFSERYLSYPIGQILSSVYGSNVHAEYRHPILVDLIDRPGAKCKVDFAVLNDNREPIVAIESKWVGDSVPSIQSVLWDLVRLELLARKFDTSCIFILGGKRKRLESLFASPDFSLKRTARAEAVLPTKTRAIRSVSLVSNDPHMTAIWRPIFGKWRTLEFPSSISTQLFQPFPKDCPLDQYQVFAWRVFSPRKKTVFKPINTKSLRG